MGLGPHIADYAFTFRDLDGDRSSANACSKHVKEVLSELSQQGVKEGGFIILRDPDQLECDWQ